MGSEIKVCTSCKKTKPLHLFEKDEKRCVVCKEKKKVYNYTYKNKDLKSYILSGVKSRAKQSKTKFNITIDDIEIPNFCPILGSIIEVRAESERNIPSIDRIDNTKGYIKGNIKIISKRANRLKSDATLTEAKAIYLYMANNI